MTQLKVGDRVICINSGVATNEGNGGAGWKEGRIFIIDRFNDTKKIAWASEDNGVFVSWLRKYQTLRDALE